MEEVTIIMPIFNREKFIKKSIESVLNQTYKEIKLILVNDGSTDNTEEICLYYKNIDSRIKYLKIDNSGPSTARNKGLELVDTKYVMFIDSDDFYQNDMVENMVNDIKNNEVQCVVCNRIMKTEKNNKKIDINSMKMNQENKQEIIEYLQKMRLFNSVWNKIYLYNIIKNNNIKFDSNFISGEDYKFNLDYFNNISLAIIENKYLYNYVMNPNSIVHDNKNLDFLKQVPIVDYNLKIYKENSFDVRNIYHRYIIIFIDAISYKIMEEHKYKKVKEYITKCINYKTMQEVINCKFKKNIEQNIIYYLIKYRLKFLIYIYIYTRNLLKKVYLKKYRRN